jgi:hypothetical protein
MCILNKGEKNDSTMKDRRKADGIINLTIRKR